MSVLLPRDHHSLGSGTREKDTECYKACWNRMSRDILQLKEKL